MKIGVKTYNDEKYIRHFQDKVDFIEVMSFTNKELLKNKKIVIHCKHQRFGINPADIEKEKAVRQNSDSRDRLLEIEDVNLC